MLGLKLTQRNLKLLETLNLQKSMIYCIVSSKSVMYASFNRKINRIKQQISNSKDNTLFRFIIKEHEIFEFFFKWYGLILIYEWKKEEIVFGIIKAVDQEILYGKDVIDLIRKRQKIPQKDSIFLYKNNKMCKQDDSIEVRGINYEKQPQIIVIKYSFMEISG